VCGHSVQVPAQTKVYCELGSSLEIIQPVQTQFLLPRKNRCGAIARASVIRKTQHEGGKRIGNSHQVARESELAAREVAHLSQHMSVTILGAELEIVFAMADGHIVGRAVQLVQSVGDIAGAGAGETGEADSRDTLLEFRKRTVAVAHHTNVQSEVRHVKS